MRSITRLMIIALLLRIFTSPSLAAPAAFGDLSADRVFGQPNFTSGAAGTLSQPQSVALDSQQNLYVADLNHNRVLEFDAPLLSGQAPNRVFGQPDLLTFAPGLSDHNLNSPVAVALDAFDNLWVADAGNNRVLEFDAPLANDAVADRVFGQPDFNSAAGAGIYNLNYPISVALDAQGNLYVAAWREHRILEYDAALADPTPDRVFGQPNFTTLDANHGGLSASSLNNPTQAALDRQGNLYVSDFGNNRVLEYDTPLASGTTADRVFGQPNFTSQTPNNGGVSASSLANPTGVTADAWGNVVISDPTNNRVLEYDTPLAHDTAADRVIGQPDFTSSTANNPSLGPGSLYFPRQLAVDLSGNLYVTDTNNHRILEYDLPTPNALPVVTSLSPYTVAAGSPAFILTVNGAGFVPGATVRWNGSDRNTFYLSSTRLSAAIPSNDVSAVGAYAVTVLNPAAGGPSAPLNLAVYARAWLDTTADGVLGQPGFNSGAANNTLLPAGANRLSQAASSVIDAHSGRLFVADFHNNRVLSWASSAAFANSQAADLVIGQPDFTSTACGSNAISVCSPTGVVLDALGELLVADSGMNRVMVFTPPFSNGMAASRVIGQPDFASWNCHFVTANQLFLCDAAGLALDAAGATVFVADPERNQVFGYPVNLSGEQTAFPPYRFGAEGCPPAGSTSAACLRSPYGVALDNQNNVYVADSGDHRVVEFTSWNLFPAASRVFGQGGSFTASAPNNGGLSANSLNFPTGVSLDGRGSLYVADQANNRILEFDDPAATDTTADRVFGQGGSFTSNRPNLGGTGAASLDLPFSVNLDIPSGSLYAADLNNSRLLEYDVPLPNPAPTLSSISPNMLAQGGPAITLTANGANFMPGAVVRFNGSSRPTTFLSSTQLNAALSAADVASGGPFAITVSNPAPSGGPSAPLNLNLYARTAADTSADGELGQPNFNSNTINNPLLPGPSSRLDSPTGLALDPNTNRLYVVDSTTSQVMSWANAAAFANGQPADLLIGHPNSGSVTAGSLANPVSAAVDRQGNLFVADWANNRVLEYAAPITSTSQALRVFGQPDFSSNTAGLAAAATLFHPAGVALDDSGNLYVADSGNNRVLVYLAPLSSGMPASQVLGQGGSFTTGLANNNGLSAGSLSLPYALALDPAGRLYVSDATNNRVLEYDAPLSPNPSASRVFGQADFTTAAPGLGASGLYRPAGVALDLRGNLYVADNGNHRLLEYHTPLLSQAADQVFGQFDFNSGAPNGPTLSSLSLFNPYGLAVDRIGDLYAADYGNRRVLEYDIPIPNDTPVLSAISPASLAAGGPDFTLGVFGAGFTINSNIVWNGSAVYSTFIDAHHLMVTLPAAWAAAGGPFEIRVFNPAPGGGLSLPISLPLYPRVPQDRAADGVLGQPDFTSDIANNIVMPSGAFRLTGPGGAAIDPQSGRLFVADANSFRVLAWPGGAAALANSQPANLVLGKPDFNTTTNPAGLDASHLEYVFGIALDAAGNLYAADSSNNRVLVYRAPLQSGMPASLVFGQNGSFTTKLANNGGVSASSLNRPVGLALDSAGNLYVVDQRNHRVLEYNSPLTTDTVADRVFGQPDFSANTANNGGISDHSLYTPLYTAVDSQGNLYVSDGLNHRVLEYDSPLTRDTTADHVFGQPNFSANIPNNGGVSAASLNTPAGLAVDRQGNLYVVDNPNARVLEYFNPLQVDGSYNTLADRVFGQPDFSSSIQNNGGVSASSLSSNVEGLAVDAQGNLFVVDQLNHRVLEYDQPLSSRVTLSPAASVQAGSPGQIMLYNVQVTNPTALAEIFDLGLTSSPWPALMQAGSLPLEAGAQAQVTVKVTIPLNAQPGAQNHLSLFVRPQSDPSSTTLAGFTTIAGAQVTAPPNAPSVLTYTDPQGQATSLQVPAGAVGAATDLIFIPVAAPASPSGLRFAGHAFNLEAYQNNLLQSPFVFSQPVTITIHYSAADVAGLDPKRLALLYWNKASLAWEDAACGAYIRDLPGMWFSAPVCHLSDFSVFEWMYHVFLPAVSR